MQKLHRQVNTDRRWDSAIESFIVAGGEFTEPIDDSPRFDSAEILRYARAIAVLNDRYGWHLDAQKVLSKLGKKLGKKCGGGWISPEKRCKSHYTNGKLNEAGKASGENLADRIRQRKSLSTVSRNGKGRELSYAFLPGNQKQSTMTARRTHAPNAGYQTPGRLTKLSGTEERRSMVGLGQHPGMKQQPDDAPIMDTPTATASATRKMNANPSAGDRIRAVAQTLKDQDKIQKGATVGVLKAAENLYANQHKMINEVAGMVNEDLDRAAAKGLRKIFDPAKTPVRIPNQRSSKEPRQRNRSVD